MNVEILQKYLNDSIDEFEFKINKRISQLEVDNNVFHVKISNFKDTLICTIIFKKLDK